MSSRRALKTAEAVREVVSMAILTELGDPRIRDVTVTYVEVSSDLRHAKVHVSIMGNETQQELGLRGLQSAAGYLQSRIASRVDLRYTPKLAFVLDQGVKRSIEVAKILRRVLPPEEPPAADEGPAAEGDPGQADTAEPPDDQQAAPPEAEPPDPGQ